MSSAATELLEKALQLPETEREWMAAELSDSLETPMTLEQEAAVLALLESRRAEYLAGRATLMDADVVMAQAKALLR
jgi:putative addiction module component (TIGR02574 family)